MLGNMTSLLHDDNAYIRAVPCLAVCHPLNSAHIKSQKPLNNEKLSHRTIAINSRTVSKNTAKTACMNQ